MFTHSGILRYSQGVPYRLIVEVDPDLGAYYRSLLPKYIKVSPGKYSTHITVVRVGKDNPNNLSAWGKYEGERIQFYYEHEIHRGRTYFWLRILCKRLEDIRLEMGLGLDNSAYSKAPLPFKKYFHITIGNTKL